MISLTMGLAAQNNEGGGSYMRLMLAPFWLFPGWSGYIFVGATGGHSHGNIGKVEDINVIKIFRFYTEIQGKKYEKSFKIKYPLPHVELINMEIREIKVRIDEK